MGYKKLPEIPKAPRLEAHAGRLYQQVGGHKVRKFSYSPYTAKSKTEYSFYADIITEEEIESPTAKAFAKASGNATVKTKKITLLAYVGTFLDFRDAVRSNEVGERLAGLTVAVGGGGIQSIGYWRNRGERRVEGENP